MIQSSRQLTITKESFRPARTPYTKIASYLSIKGSTASIESVKLHGNGATFHALAFLMSGK